MNYYLAKKHLPKLSFFTDSYCAGVSDKHCLLTFFILSIFEWPFYTGFTVFEFAVTKWGHPCPLEIFLAPPQTHLINLSGVDNVNISKF